MRVHIWQYCSIVVQGLVVLQNGGTGLAARQYDATYLTVLQYSDTGFGGS